MRTQPTSHTFCNFEYADNTHKVSRFELSVQVHGCETCARSILVELSHRVLCQMDADSSADSGLARPWLYRPSTMVLSSMLTGYLKLFKTKPWIPRDLELSPCGAAQLANWGPPLFKHTGTKYSLRTKIWINLDHRSHRLEASYQHIKAVFGVSIERVETDSVAVRVWCERPHAEILDVKRTMTMWQGLQKTNLNYYWLRLERKR